MYIVMQEFLKSMNYLFDNVFIKIQNHKFQFQQEYI